MTAPLGVDRMKTPDPQSNGNGKGEASIPSPSFMELGVTGLKRSAGYVFEEFHPKLNGDKALKIYEEMMANSPMVGATLFAITMFMRQVTWRVDPCDESEAALEQAEFIESCRMDMSHSWEDFLSEAFTMVPFGWSYHEIVYKRRTGTLMGTPGASSRFNDGLIGWRKLPIRAQSSREKWEFDSEGGIKGMYQLAPPDYKRVFIPIEKALLFRPELAKNNPEGKSALRIAYRPWFFGKRIEEIEGIGIERDLAGLPVMEVPAAMTKSTAPADMQQTFAAFKNLVRNIRRDEQEGAVIPQEYDQHGNPLYKLTLLASGGKRNFDTTAILNRYDARIAMCVLADFVLLGHEKVGSFALEGGKRNTFSTALAAWVDSMAEVMNRHAIPRLIMLNGMNPELMPKLAHGEIETPPLPEIADYIAKLAGAGMPIFPDLKVENILREHVNLPEMSEEEFEEREARLEEQKAAELEAQTAAEKELIDAKGSTTPKKE
jgi:hypothetical protein